MKKYLLLTVIVAMQIAMALFVWYASDKSEEVQIKATNLWMLFNASSWVLAFAIMAMLSVGLFRELAIILVIMWLGNVCDEIWFDPTIPQINDIASLGIAYSLALVRITYHLTKNK